MMVCKNRKYFERRCKILNTWFEKNGFIITERTPYNIKAVDLMVALKLGLTVKDLDYLKNLHKIHNNV